MMYQNSNFKYTETADFQALRMPYGNGAYAMTILLPKEEKTISDVLNTLTAKKWEMFQLMADAIVDVKLPRFESTSDITLNKIMATLGMPNAFDIDLAEFPNFCPVDTYIGLMKQVAKIKLNEEGTEAAAVTVIGVNDKVSIEPEPMCVNFHATRPFLYVISEQSTGAIFFIGQYMGD
jgi:serpin B